MSDEKDGKTDALLSRRAVGRNALKMLLAGGVSAMGLMAMSKKAHAGYGQCSASGCYCQAYAGNAYTCANCGHNYSMHW